MGNAVTLSRQPITLPAMNACAVPSGLTTRAVRVSGRLGDISFEDKRKAAGRLISSISVTSDYAKIKRNMTGFPLC